MCDSSLPELLQVVVVTATSTSIYYVVVPGSIVVSIKILMNCIYLDAAAREDSTHGRENLDTWQDLTLKFTHTSSTHWHYKL